MLNKIIRVIVPIFVFLLIISPALAVQIDNPLRVETPQEFAGLIIKTLLGLVGVVALIYFIVGGFTWMTAGGNSEKIKKGRDTLVWAVIGLVVIFASYSIVNFVLEQIGQSTSS